jgi:pilus assembly protein CpaD
MTRMLKPGLAQFALGAGLVTLGACATSAPTSISSAELQGTSLSRHEIQVAKRTEFLEVAIHPEASELSHGERARIRDFVAAFAQSGHGPLVLSMPQETANPQLAVTAVAEARAIAWEKGIEYSEIAGSAHGSGSGVAEPLILAFQVYDAIPPECKPKSAYDFSDVSSNNALPSLGCSVRVNQAAMIADPADLLGNRPLERSDIRRREVILEKFRLGEPTGAVRSDQESGAVSTVVN